MKIKDIFRKYINKVHLEVVYTNDEEQNEIVTILEYFKYHFETGTPLREYHFQDGSNFNAYSFWGGKNVALGLFDENKNWFSKPVVFKYEDYHPLYVQIMTEINKISIDDFSIQCNQKDNFGVWIKVSKEIQEKYEEKFGIKDEGMNAIFAEYHNDDDTYFYGFLPSDSSETFDATKDFSYLNDLMKQYFEENAK